MNIEHKDAFGQDIFAGDLVCYTRWNNPLAGVVTSLTKGKDKSGSGEIVGKVKVSYISHPNSNRLSYEDLVHDLSRVVKLPFNALGDMRSELRDELCHTIKEIRGVDWEW